MADGTEGERLRERIGGWGAMRAASFVPLFVRRCADPGRESRGRAKRAPSGEGEGRLMDGDRVCKRPEWTALPYVLFRGPSFWRLLFFLYTLFQRTMDRLGSYGRSQAKPEFREYRVTFWRDAGTRGACNHVKSSHRRIGWVRSWRALLRSIARGDRVDASAGPSGACG